MKQKITYDEYFELCEAIVIDYIKDKNAVIWHQMILYWCISFPTEIPNWLAYNSKTSKATALLIYWKLGSSFYKKYKTKAEFMKESAEFASEYDLAKTIEDRYVSGFYKGEEIYFNPCIPDYKGVIWSEEHPNIEDARRVPKIMYEKLEGQIVMENPEFIEGYPLELYNITTVLLNAYELI